MPELKTGSLSPALPYLSHLAELARKRGETLWLTGGTLRDLFLGIDPPDIDLAVKGQALALGRELAADKRLTFVPLGQAHATCRLVGRGQQIDLTGLRAPEITSDLRGRDFTINALAWELNDFLAGREKILDPTGGRADLKARQLRPAGPEVLRDDPLRVLRAFRFMSTHRFSFGAGLAQALGAAGPGLFRVAAERVSHEWMLMMAGPGAAEAVRGLEEAQVLTRLVPELSWGRGLSQNPFHHLDILEHNLAAVEALGEIAADPQKHLGGLGREVDGYLGSAKKRFVLFTAALFHDLGKPATRKQKEPGWASFHRHDIAGASLSRRACRRLGLSKADSGAVSRLIGGHMRPFHLMGVDNRGQLSTRAVRRLLVSAGEDLPGLMALALADTMAGNGPLRPADAEQKLVALYQRIADLRDRELAKALAAPPLINGKDLIEDIGMKSGPEIGRILSLVREAQLDGEVADKPKALALAGKLFKEHD